MSTHDIKDSELKAVQDGLVQLGKSIEIIAKRELPKPEFLNNEISGDKICLLYTSPSPRDLSTSRMPSSA